MKITQHKIENVSISKVLELPFNRTKDEKQIKTMMNSMVQVGILRTPVFIRTKAITGRYETYTAVITSCSTSCRIMQKK